MSTFLSREIREGLAEAHKQTARKRTRLKVRASGAEFPIVRFSQSNFALEAQDAPKLRGLVDIYDGARHLYQALIVTSQLQGDEVEFEFKRNTVAADRPAVDFERDIAAPVGLLPST
jgi:hypothetical protein